MAILGWSLFGIGACLLVVFAFVGVDVGAGSVMNLSGTLVGSAMMISGAVFVAGARIEQAVNGKQNSPAQNEVMLSGIKSEAEKQAEVRKGWAIFGLIIVGLIILGGITSGL